MTSSRLMDSTPGSGARVERPLAVSERERSDTAVAIGRLSSFVGREAELAEIARLLAATRMLTLTGPGGVGKTRLARQTAAAAAADRSGGVVFVELDRLEDPGLVPGALLSALGAGEKPTESPLRTAARELEDAHALVVLDNCEHVRDASAELAQGLLLDCRRVRVLATSRESPLGVAGEVLFSVPGMGLPLHDGQDGVGEFDAVQLFVARARQVRPGFVLDGSDRGAVAGICRALEGMPLAIELAAARLRILTATQIAHGLSDHLQLLRGPGRGAVARHRTLRASIEWSHALLDARERTLLRRLSVFAGGFDLEAAEVVCAGGEIECSEVLELVGALVDKSLIATQRYGEVIRYRLLETVRQYAGERLEEVSERGVVQALHGAYFRGLAVEADSLRLDPGGRDRLAVEEPNFRAALDHAADTEPEAALAIAAGLSRWWIERDNYREGRVRCARALAAGDPEAWPALRAIVHCGAGQLALYQVDFQAAAQSIDAALTAGEAAGDARALGRAHALAAAGFACMAPVEGVRHGQRAVELLRALGDPVELTWALAPLATAYAATDDYRAARATAEECTALAQAHGDAVASAWAEWILGVVCTFAGEPRAGAEHARRALALIGDGTPVLHGLALSCALHADALIGNAETALEQGTAGLERALATSALGAAGLRPALCLVHAALGGVDQACLVGEPATNSGILYFEGNAHDALARVSLARADALRAREHAAELERLAEATANRRFRAQAEYVHGRCALLDGDAPRAREHLHAALGAQLELGARLHAIDTLEALGACAAKGASQLDAARLLAVAASERQRLGVIRVPPETDWLQQLRRDGADELGEQSYLAAWREGEAISFADAIALVQRSRGSRERPLAGWDALTPTEAQVAALAAQGLSNPQIAARLFVSRGTVKVHLSRAFSKLGVSNRTALAHRVPQEKPEP
jgi:predicted ATPase/DNA-binding NarL/FixJ family response regulator